MKYIVFVIFQYGYKPAEADWSRELRGKQLVSCVPLDNWACIFTRRDSNSANDFVQTLHRVAGPMGIAVKQPNM